MKSFAALTDNSLWNLAFWNLEAGIVHNDLRHFNTMLDKSCDLKIIDLGISDLAQEVPEEVKPATLCGPSLLPKIASPSWVFLRPWSIGKPGYSPREVFRAAATMLGGSLL